MASAEAKSDAIMAYEAAGSTADLDVKSIGKTSGFKKSGEHQRHNLLRMRYSHCRQE